MELARATAEDPHAGLPEERFATDLPDLGLVDPSDREITMEERIDEARRAERSARDVDPRICNSEGSEVSATFSRVAYGNMAAQPVRAEAVERALGRGSLTEQGIQSALAVATDGLNPPTDGLASEWYRREVAPIHLRRLLLGSTG